MMANVENRGRKAAVAGQADEIVKHIKERKLKIFSRQIKELESQIQESNEILHFESPGVVGS
jgi:hypothetical protein